MAIYVHQISCSDLTVDNRAYVDRAFLGEFAKLRKATMSFVMSVRLSIRPSAWNNLAPTGRDFHEI